MKVTEHPFWFLLVMTCVLWYSTITIYVSIRGVFDIRGMLRNLRDGSETAEPETFSDKAIER